MTTTTWGVAAVTATAIIAQQLFMGRAVVGLSVALGLAFVVWLARPPRPGWRPESLLVVFVVGIAVQVAHFVEEWTTGFAREFPALLGYEWSDDKFVVFNAAWLLVFVGAAWGVHRRSSDALVVVWFFGVVAIANGVLHVTVAVWRGAYFPGVVTAPVLFVVAVLLVQRLIEVTSVRATKA